MSIRKMYVFMSTAAVGEMLTNWCVFSHQRHLSLTRSEWMHEYCDDVAFIRLWSLTYDGFNGPWLLDWWLSGRCRLHLVLNCCSYVHALSMCWVYVWMTSLCLQIHLH